MLGFFGTSCSEYTIVYEESDIIFSLGTGYRMVFMLSCKHSLTICSFMNKATASNSRTFVVMNRVLKVFIGIVLVMCIFLCGVACGAKLASMHQRFASFTVGQQGKGVMVAGMAGERMMVRKGDSMHFMQLQPVWKGEGTMASGTVRLVGSISKIDGNKITVLDNGAKAQVVMSQAITMIRAATGMISLTNLKVGENVIVMGVTAEDGSVTARSIETF